jgi:hypothetical protein
MRSLVANPRTWALLTAVALALASRAAIGALPVVPPAAYQLRLDAGHPWRPPFRLDRVGQPIAAVVESSAQPSPAVYTIQAFLNGNPVGSQTLSFTKNAPYSARVTLEGVIAADELVLSAMTNKTSKPAELVRQRIALREIEADAVAIPDRLVNPVDLGTILVPSGWLLLGPGQTATLEVAAISRTRDLTNAKVRASFNSAQAKIVSRPSPMRAGVRTRLDVKLAVAPPTGDRDVLTVTLDDGAGRELWRKAIPVMLARDPLGRPRFGATRRSPCASPEQGSFPACDTKTAGSPTCATLSSGYPTAGGSSSGEDLRLSRSGPAFIIPRHATSGPRSSLSRRELSTVLSP